MKRLKLEDKLKVYKKALSYFKDKDRYGGSGFCLAIKHATCEVLGIDEYSNTFTDMYNPYDLNIFEHQYSEIWKFKPEIVEGNMWFPRSFNRFYDTTRIDILKKAIAIVEKKINRKVKK